MIERMYVWFFGESVLVMAGLTFALLIAASEAGYRLGGRYARQHPDREHERAGVGTITTSMLALRGRYRQSRKIERPFVRIHSGDASPNDAYAAVRYRQHWYWIDDADFGAKRAFSFLMLSLSLAQTGSTPQPPAIAIPAN